MVDAEKELSSEDSSCNTPYYYTIFFILSHDVFVQSMGFTAGPYYDNFLMSPKGWMRL